MLKSILTKLVECMELHNRYALSMAPTLANDYASKCKLLTECLKDSGYESELKMEAVEVTHGEYSGCKGNVFACVKVYMPTDGSFAFTNKNIKEFEAIGFEQLPNNAMYHKFEYNRKEN